MPVYDAFAWFYYRYWCADYHPWAESVLERILLPRLGPGARVLDLCCGVGTLTGTLVRRGFQVTGMDASAEMLRYARQDCEAEFVCADAREFRRPGAFDAVVSTFDSMNHILSGEDLAVVFGNVRASLAPGGVFVFDLLTDEAFIAEWTRTGATVEPDHVIIVRGSFNAQERLGRTDITTFRLEGTWHRSDAAVTERCYGRQEARALLEQAGFGTIEIHHGAGGWGEGRLWFVAAAD